VGHYLPGKSSNRCTLKEDRHLQGDAQLQFDVVHELDCHQRIQAIACEVLIDINLLAG
jgi:hypothetical protein